MRVGYIEICLRVAFARGRDFFSAGAPDYKSEMVPSLEVCVHKAEGVKCDRCWNFSTHVGENSRYPTICERCSAALAEIEGASS